MTTTKSWIFCYILTSLYASAFASLHHHGTGKYTNTWVVEVNDDHPDTARKLAEELNLHYHGQAGSLKNLHVMQHKTLESGLNRTSDEHHQKIISHHKVLYAGQEQIISRKKRGYIKGKKRGYIKGADPDYPKQWFLKNTGQTSHLCDKLYDVNVEPVWKEGITGKNVVVAILDDGLEYTHPDLKRNFNLAGSFNFNARPYKKNPKPRYTPDDLNKHGTRCAGEVAAERGNGVCGRGVAYNAQIAGIRMLDGEVSDIIEAGSLSYRRDLIDIYSSSWGPDDDGYTVDGPGVHTRRALKEGILYGRQGLGSIFVWATGNGGGFYDYCSCDGYINSPYTISIGAVNNCGQKPWYSEPCPGTLAVTFSSGETHRDLQIVTTDLHDKCTDSHTGTSAAAPLAAGIFALVLEANPKLTWRDVQHLVVHTSQKVDPTNRGWKQNGAGLYVNENFGFGSLDAKALVDAVRDPNWKTADPRQIYETPVKYVGLHRVPKSQSQIISKIPFSPKSSGVCMNKLEHVHAIVSLKLSKSRHRGNRGKHSITLTSPQGTVSKLLLQRPRDYFHSSGHLFAFKEWEFMTVFNWDENPEGVWILKITDHSPYSYSSWADKTHLSWKLRLSGTCKKMKWPVWDLLDTHNHK